MTTRRITLLVALVFLSAFAAIGATEQALVVTGATASPDQQTLRIAGANFCGAPEVTLNGIPLKLAGSPASAESIEVRLPEIEAGSYLLRVSCGEGATSSAFVLRVGPTAFTISSLSAVLTFPPGGVLKVFDASIHAASLILVNYVNGSRGNALSIYAQGEGYATFSGSPRKDFRYVVINGD